ncbi:MAG TPA: hypothetical protein VII36_07350, partial [Usitatibacter sp.]
DRGGGPSARWRDRVERELAARGVAPESLYIEPMREYPDFLAGVARADLILDSPGFSGGATSLDAFAMGTPVLCFEGGSARGRQTSAMLRLMDMPDLIARDEVSYVDRAVELLAEPGRLEALRGLIRERAGRLFDGSASLAAFAAFLRACKIP